MERKKIFSVNEQEVAANKLTRKRAWIERE